MGSSYETGIMAYCQTASNLLMCADNEDRDQTAIEVSLIRDIFGRKAIDPSGAKTDSDRNKKIAERKNRLYHSSGSRAGSSNRPSKFESAWLDKNLKDYRDELERYCRNDGSLSIVEESERVRELRTRARKYGKTAEWKSSSTHKEMESEAELIIAKKAINACVSNMIEENDDGLYSELKYLMSVFDSAKAFQKEIIPAVLEGFGREQFERASSEGFKENLEGLLDKLGCWEYGSQEWEEAFAEFATCLVAALVYGPNHSLAIGDAGREGTIAPDYLWRGQLFDDAIKTDSICITQVLDDYSGEILLRGEYGAGDVVFIGRCPEVDEYYQEFKKKYGPDSNDYKADLYNVINSKKDELKVFTINNNLFGYVSRTHGFIIHEGSSWRYYDLSSSNGSSIRSFTSIGDDCVPVDGSIQLKAGNTLFLGLGNSEFNASCHIQYAALLVSFYVNPSLL